MIILVVEVVEHESKQIKFWKEFQMPTARSGRVCDVSTMLSVTSARALVPCLGAVGRPRIFDPVGYVRHYGVLHGRN